MLERELKTAEAQAGKMRKALAALQALDGHGEGARVSRKRIPMTCGCGTRFTAKRRDARFCPTCRKLKRDRKPLPTKPATRGVSLGRNTPKK